MNVRPPASRLAEGPLASHPPFATDQLGFRIEDLLNHQHRVSPRTTVDPGGSEERKVAEVVVAGPTSRGGPTDQPYFVVAPVPTQLITSVGPNDQVITPAPNDRVGPATSVGVVIPWPQSDD